MSLGAQSLGAFTFGGGDEDEGRAFFVPAFLRITPTRAGVRIKPYESAIAITPHDARLEVTGA